MILSNLSIRIDTLLGEQVVPVKLDPTTAARFFTAAFVEEVAARFGEHGPAAFVQKPFRRRELLSKLRGALGD